MEGILRMSKETAALTLNPQLAAFHKSLLAKYEEANKSVKPGQTLFVGSSIMELFPIEKWEEAGEVKFDHYIYNRAVRATTTAFMLEHMDVQVFDLAPSKIFINIGTNDIGFEVPEAEFQANYEAIIRQIQEKLPDTEIFMLKYYPINSKDFGHDSDEQTLFKTRSNAAFDHASELNRQLADKLSVHFIDLSDGLANDEGNLKPELTLDGAHLNEDGCRVVLENLKPYLE